MHIERIFLALVSLLLLGGFGLIGAGLAGGRPDLVSVGQGLLAAAVGLSCVPLVGLGVVVLVERVRGRGGSGGG